MGGLGDECLIGGLTAVMATHAIVCRTTERASAIGR